LYPHVDGTRINTDCYVVRNFFRDPNFENYSFIFAEKGMKLPRYEYVTESEAELFKFTSEGTKGSIRKLVVYTQMLEKDIYNLAFGDYHEETNSINDKVITDNKDSPKVFSNCCFNFICFYLQTSKRLGLCDWQ